MPNKFKAALAATSLAGVFLASGPDIEVYGFEVEILQNQAVAEVVTGAIESAKPVEPYTVIALGGGRSNGEGGRGDGNESKGGGHGHGVGLY